uniref:RNase H type-1 domain-containing protein n=1 Tax=Cannabis sativa TaxID=3483 RepID=A0A803PRG4_CANSA
MGLTQFSLIWWRRSVDFYGKGDDDDVVSMVVAEGIPVTLAKVLYYYRVVSSLAQALLTDWTRAQDHSRIPTVAFLTAVDGLEKWVKPEAVCLKINVDATIFAEAATYSFVGVARDAAGDMVEAFSYCRSGVLQPEMVEVLGVKEALS